MQPVPAGYPIAELSGPIIVGCLLNWGLFGTLSVQLYLYYLAFPNDRRFTKYLVYGIYVIEFMQTVLIAHDVFAAFGYGFGDIDALARINFFWLTVPIMGAVAACVGQVFYAYRIFILSKSRIIPIFIICVSLTNTVASMLRGIYAFQVGDITKLTSRKVHVAAGISCGASALCDFVIAICMTYYLMRSTTNLRPTQILITKIIRLTIETGSVTGIQSAPSAVVKIKTPLNLLAVVALFGVVLLTVFPHQTSYIATGLLVPKLYANSVYMVLNSRFQIIGGRDTYMSSTDMSFSTTMIRDIVSQSAEDDARPAEGMRGRAPVAVLSNGVFNDNLEMGQDKPQDSCMSLPV